MPEQSYGSHVPGLEEAPRGRPVTVFWDYENQLNPKNQSFQHTWNLIRTHLLEHFERIAHTWVFLNTAMSNIDDKLRAEICNSGCSIVDCAPSSMGKNAQVDQRVIVGLFSATMDHSHAVCLISADGDYCHVLNLLRNHRVFTALLYNTHGAALNPMCATSVDLCIGMDFRVARLDGDEGLSPEDPEDPEDVLRLKKSIQECTGVGQNNSKLAATVGTIFHNKVSGALQDRKRRFATAKAALINAGSVKVVERNLAQYFELLN